MEDAEILEWRPGKIINAAFLSLSIMYPLERGSKKYFFKFASGPMEWKCARYKTGRGGGKELGNTESVPRGSVLRE